MSFNNNYINVKAISYKGRNVCSLIPPRFVSGKFILNEDFDYYVGELGSDFKITVPEGFEFDGVSVPFPASSILPKTHPIYMKAACLHDYLYSNPDIQIDRLKADEIFYESMIVLETPRFWAYIMYISVRMFGWKWWYRRRGGYKLFNRITIVRKYRNV